MCGLLGFSGHKGQTFDKNKIRTLFLYNQERGKDASGFWSPKNNLVKSLDQATKFLTKDFKKIQEDCLLIGHVRQGTIGKNMLGVAHPFEGNTAVLAHNGTLSNYIKLASKYEIQSADYTTDTQVLHKILDTNFGTKILTEIDGSASLLIADKNISLKKGQENSFLMTFRLNNQRPLFYGITEEGMYISSIEESLDAIDCTEIKEFKTNVLYSIFEGKIIKEVVIPQRPIPSYSSSNYANSNYSDSNTALTGADIHYWTKYLNNWIKADRTNPIQGVEQNKYYLLKEVSIANKTLTIENDLGEEFKDVPVFSFYYNQPNKPLNGTVNSYVVVMKKLTDTKDKNKIVFNRGDVVNIKSLEKVDSQGNKTVCCLSYLDNDYYDVNIKFVRPCENHEIMLYNIVDPELEKTNIQLSNKHNNTNSDNSNNSNNNFSIIRPENESFIAQYIVESGLLTSDELSEMVLCCNNKEISDLFDLAEESIITLNDMNDVLQEETDALSMISIKALNNYIDETKEKISSLLINAIGLWKKQQLV